MASARGRDDHFPLRIVLVVAAIVLAVPAAWALFAYGTLRPCEMVKYEARRFVMVTMTEEMKKPVSNTFEAAGRNIGMAMAAVMVGPLVDGFVSTLTTTECLRAVVRLNVDRDAATADLKRAMRR